MRRNRWWVAVTAGLLVVACARYEQRPLSFRVPSAYPNAAEVLGATVAAESFDDPAAAREAFGFDVVGAGILPVQVIFDHRGTDPIEIVPSQTFLVDAQGRLWNILEQNLAYSRLEKKTELGEVAPRAGKGALLGAAAGAIVGAAIGIVTGRSIPEALGKGAAVGAAGGAVVGGSQGLDEPSVRRSIGDDLRNRSLTNKPVPPQGMSQGVLFFPAEARDARTLRLQLRETRTGEVRALDLAL